MAIVSLCMYFSGLVCCSTTYCFRFKKLAWLSIGFLLLVHGCKTYTRNFDWESEYTIFMAGLKVNHRNAKLFNNVGHALESQGRFQEALQYFQKAIRLESVTFLQLLCFQNIEFNML
jgi:tetratricopeptide (TPR) repeat protein